MPRSTKPGQRQSEYSALRALLKPIAGEAVNLADGPQSIFAGLASINPKDVKARLEAALLAHTADASSADDATASFPSMGGVKKYLTELCVEIAIREHSSFFGAFGFNIFKNRIEWVKPLDGIEAGQEWSTQDDMRVLLFVQDLGINANRRHVELVIDYLARQNPVDPVVSYLDRLEWDGVKRLDQWLPTYFGGADTPYSAFIGAKFLLSAVARQLKPGCQVDHMLILEGHQGLGKTRGLETLFGSDWVNDNMPKIGTRSSAMAISGFMLVNIDELGVLPGSDCES